MDRAVFDRMAEIDAEHWWFQARRKIVAALIAKEVRPRTAARILEVGCGTGSNLKMLQFYGEVDAIEPDAPARELAAARSGLPIKEGLLPDGVQLEDGAYDLIVLLDVLEHIPDDLGTLSALRTKLSPGGQLLVTVPAMPWLWSAHDAAHHHQRRYTSGTLTRVFESAGFRVRYRSHFNTVLFPLVVAARAAGKLLGRETGDDAMPPRPLNSLLKTLFASERHLLTRLRFPFGVSLALVAEPATTMPTGS